MRVTDRGSILRAGKQAAALILSLMLAGAPTNAAEPTLSAADAQAVLDRFVGTWKTRASIKNANATATAREIFTQGMAECRRTLADNWWEFRTETVPPGEADLQVMTFDAPRGVFRQWVFSSDGYFHSAEGTWDAATSTLRWSGTTAKGRFVIDDHWPSADRLEWSLRRTDSQGRELQTIDGTVERSPRP
jgi:hypothetical protein